MRGVGFSNTKVLPIIMRARKKSDRMKENYRPRSFKMSDKTWKRMNGIKQKDKTWELVFSEILDIADYFYNLRKP